MKSLNCSVGDLAITIKCHCPENLGTIVRIKESKGVISWPQQEELMQVWGVEVLSKNKWLVYELNGVISTFKEGPVPDKFLRRLTPPNRSLCNEAETSEPCKFTALAPLPL
jgi:hypothetical protein